MEDVKCSKCSNAEPLLETKSKDGDTITVGVYGKELFYVNGIVYNGSHVVCKSILSIDINFCPICGRKL